MIASNGNSMCERFKPYFYDYLYNRSQGNIPADILAHIDQCRVCQAEVERLQIELSKTQENEGQNLSQRNSAIITNLSLHFAHTGASVTCKTVRPFLPSLADPVLIIRVPTPITVHLDKCQQCADDLETLQKLKFTHKQFCRLGQLFAELPCSDSHDCSESQKAIASVAMMDLGNINASVLKHLSVCSNCRKLLYQHRQTIHEGLLESKTTNEKFSCESVLVSDLFDYCFPYGIDPADDQYAKFRSSLISHLSTCPTCLDKMQELHTAVYGILEHSKSGIVTCFKIDNSARDDILSGSSDIYEDWPIEVQVSGESSEIDTLKAEDTDVPMPIKPKQKSAKWSIKPFVKPIIAAAAVFMVILLLFNSPVAKAVDIGRIYKALKQIKNVCIATFIPKESETVQERWISEKLDIMILKNETEYVLWNIKTGQRKTKDLNTGSIKTIVSNKDAILKARQAMGPPWGILPFDDISDLPPDYKWQQVADENIETQIADTEIYDLIWTEKRLRGLAIFHKWRFYINTRTNLPKRIERFRKRSEEQEYELLDTKKISYPTAVEIQDVINDVDF